MTIWGTSPCYNTEIFSMNRLSAKLIIEIFKVVSKSNDSLSFSEKWKITKKKAKAHIRGSDVDFGQSWKSASGKAFEKLAIKEVLDILDSKDFTDENIVAKTWHELTRSEKDELQVPLRRKCDNKRIYISNEPDIVIFKNNTAVAILSCKSSLRDRVSIDLYWHEVNQRENRKFLVVSAEPREKLGTHKRPLKPRRIAECVYERLYIVDGDTDYCKVVRPLKDIKGDLKKWFIT